MRYVTTAEVWVPARESFIFRYIVPAKGAVWTFVVSREALEKLSNGPVADLELAFHRWRPRIYLAAMERMTWADAAMQQELSADEIVAASP